MSGGRERLREVARGQLWHPSAARSPCHPRAHILPALPTAVPTVPRQLRLPVVSSSSSFLPEMAGGDQEAAALSGVSPAGGWHCLGGGWCSACGLGQFQSWGPRQVRDPCPVHTARTAGCC